jgi:hypothetical protein
MPDQKLDVLFRRGAPKNNIEAGSSFIVYGSSFGNSKLEARSWRKYLLRNHPNLASSF